MTLCTVCIKSFCQYYFIYWAPHNHSSWSPRFEKKQIYIVMRNIIFFNGGNVIQSPCLFFREFRITWRRDKSCQSSDSTFLETAINMEKRSIVIRLKTVFYWVTTVRLLCNFMTLSKALSQTCFSPLKKEQIVPDEH